MAEGSIARHRSLIISPPPSTLEVDDEVHVGSPPLLRHLPLIKVAYYLQ